MNATQEEKLKELIVRLQSIAEKNEDEFSFNMEIVNDRTGFHFTFSCNETAEGHSFLEGRGRSIDSMIADAEREIPEAISLWNYEAP